MRPQTSLSCILSLLTAISLSPLTVALDILESTSLNSCQSGSGFTATLFNVAYTPKNNSIAVHINGVSSIVGNVTAQLEGTAYGFSVVNETLDPCKLQLSGFCPMQAGQQINIDTNIGVPSSVAKDLPGIAYTVPDLDGVVRVYVISKDTGETIACMEADLSNTKSIYNPAVGWATAVIAGLGLVAAGLTSGLGHPNTAAHVAANAVSLFGFFQAQAIIGMTSVRMPPIVQSWTQNFQWSMGIIRVSFLQSIATWYQRATGGTPTTYLSTLSTYSVQVQKRAIKRSLQTRAAYATAGIRALARRADSTGSTVDNVKVVRGIDRVGFRAGIEQTNIFMTGLIFFVFILFLVALLVALTKVILDGCVKAGCIKSDKFFEFRNGWKIVIKGILFRLVLLGFVQMSILCLWEIIERDSAAEVILAIIVFISMATTLGWASFKVIHLAKKSVAMHKNPAYTLYSDPECLNRWGFLYVQYRATSYYFVVPLLGYILFKAVFIAFAQSSPVAQAVGLVIVECAALIGVSVVRPFMDKKTNIFNISICAVNFLNAIFLLVFSDAFDQPEMVSGVMGVIFAFYNLIFSAVLLILVLIASIYAIASKNPEVRYQPLRDDRGSFIKSQAALTTELDALGATARGDGRVSYIKDKGSDDDASFSSESLQHLSEISQMQERPMSQNNCQQPTYQQQQQTPVNPSENNGRREPPQSYEQRQMANGGYGDYSYGSQRPGTAPNQYERSNSNLSTGYAPPRPAHGGYPPQQGYRQ